MFYRFMLKLETSDVQIRLGLVEPQQTDPSEGPLDLKLDAELESHRWCTCHVSLSLLLEKAERQELSGTDLLPEKIF